MKENTKRIIDCLALLVLGLPAAIFWFDYTNNQYSKTWIVLLIFDIPFAIAALLWLGWRFLSMLPRGERTKRVIDWLTLIPLGYMPAMTVWFHYTHNAHPSTIWIVLVIIDIPFAFASLLWLGLRMDQIGLVHWFTFRIAASPFRLILFCLMCWATALFIKWLRS